MFGEREKDEEGKETDKNEFSLRAKQIKLADFGHKECSRVFPFLDGVGGASTDPLESQTTTGRRQFEASLPPREDRQNKEIKSEPEVDQVASRGDNKGA